MPWLESAGSRVDAVGDGSGVVLLRDVLCVQQRLDEDVDVVGFLVDDLELDGLLPPRPQRLHRRGDFAPQDLGDAVADAELDLVFPDHAPDAVSEPLDLETLGNAAHQRDGVDGGADFLEEPADEVRLVHAVVEQVVPEVWIVLLLGKGNGVRNVTHLVDDEEQGFLYFASLGEDVAA